MKTQRNETSENKRMENFINAGRMFINTMTRLNKKIPEIFFRKFLFLIIAALLISITDYVHAQNPDSLTLLKLKKLSLEELLSLEVTSVTLHPENLSEVASAVQIITGKDIQRSSAIRLPEALRLSSNLQVSQSNAHDWAITARGFSGVPSAGGIVANKLLVMIDGRSIYTPLFGGVYWDVQNVMLHDVDQIEVVSGPGGTIWGANAVNGVINVVSKNAKETQGWYLSGAGGSFLKDFAEARYGGKAGDKLYYRIYGQRFDHNSADLSGIAADTIDNGWFHTQGGFRIDYFQSKKTTLTLQGDLYSGDANLEYKRSLTSGQNVLANLTHIFSKKSNLNIRMYFDHAYRKTPNSVSPFFYDLYTYDLNIRHSYTYSKRHKFLFGGGYQYRKDKTARVFNPLSKDMPVFNLFIQDEITLVPKQLDLIIGSKLSHNIYTGVEVQPSTRLSWTPEKHQTIWAAVSRAVRTPSRFDADIITVTDFDSEKIWAYEIGYRVRPKEYLLLSFATFFNDYYQLRSIDSANTDSDPQLELVLANSQRAGSWGFELSVNYIVTGWWHLRGGFTFFQNSIWPTHSLVAPLSPILESVDPENTIIIQSIMDLPKNLKLDIIARFTDKLPQVSSTPETPAYFTFDTRFAWQYKWIEISLVGQNLMEAQHTETGLSRIPRSFYGKIICQF